MSWWLRILIDSLSTKLSAIYRGQTPNQG